MTANEKTAAPNPVEPVGGEVLATPMVRTSYGTEEPAYRMDAYYYGFCATGIAAIDLVLSAVARAGKSFHHTEEWNKNIGEREGVRGETPVDWIQNAADDAAKLIRTLAGIGEKS